MAYKRMKNKLPREELDTPEISNLPLGVQEYDLETEKQINKMKRARFREKMSENQDRIESIGNSRALRKSVGEVSKSTLRGAVTGGIDWAKGRK